MKLAVATTLIVLIVGTATPVSAAVVQYPYCIIYRDGLRSCGFRNLQDCVRVRVGADMCVVNPYYTRPQPQPRRRVR